MRHFDLSPLYRSSVGFDRIFSTLDALSSLDTANTAYPPYNIERLGEHSYRISMAVAGFSEDDLSIEVKENTLTISGEKPSETEETEGEFLHRGIAGRAFTRQFKIAQHVEVTSASLDNGLLHVDLKHELPEAMKPRSIKISSATDTRVIEQKKH